MILLGKSLTAIFGGGGSGDVVGATSSTDNAIARFDGTTGKIVQNSNVTISDAGNVGINGSASPTNKLIINSSSTGYTEEFKINNSVDPLVGATRFTISNTQGSLQINQYGSTAGASLANGAGVFGSGSGAMILGTVNNNSTAEVCLFTNNGFAAPDFRIRKNGNIGIGRNLTSAEITARLQIRGAGATSATKTLVVENSSGMSAMEVLDDRTVIFNLNAKFGGQIIDNVGSSGADGQVLKKVGGLVLWSNP